MRPEVLEMSGDKIKKVFRSVDILISGDIQVNDCLLIIANTITDSFGDNSSVKFRN